MFSTCRGELAEMFTAVRLMAINIQSWPRSMTLHTHIFLFIFSKLQSRPTLESVWQYSGRCDWGYTCFWDQRADTDPQPKWNHTNHMDVPRLKDLHLYRIWFWSIKSYKKKLKTAVMSVSVPVNWIWAVYPSKNIFILNVSSKLIVVVTPVSALDSITPAISWGVLLAFSLELFSCTMAERQIRENSWFNHHKHICRETVAESSSFKAAVPDMSEKTDGRIEKRMLWLTHAHQNCPALSQGNVITAHSQGHALQKHHIIPTAFPKLPCHSDRFSFHLHQSVFTSICDS